MYLYSLILPTINVKTTPIIEKTIFITDIGIWSADDSDLPPLTVSIDLRKGARVIYDGWSYSKWVNIKGNIGYYQWFGNGGKVNHYGELIIGWFLRWAQDGTSVEMLSYNLSQNQILEIAR